MVAEALTVALSKNPEIFNHVTWLNGTLRLTVIAVPLGAEVQVYDEQVGVTVPTEMPDPERTAVIRFCTSVCVMPSRTATRQPSRAAVVSNWVTIPSRAASIIPTSSVTNTGAMRAISTALAPRRRSAHSKGVS
jgi:hypothetical protein